MAWMGKAVIVETISAHAHEFPDKIALVHERGSWSYATFARRILAACARVQRRHHVLASGHAHGRAVAALDAIADGVNACPAPARSARLSATPTPASRPRSSLARGRAAC
jgi:hypothetical protein